MDLRSDISFLHTAFAAKYAFFFSFITFFFSVSLHSFSFHPRFFVFSVSFFASLPKRVLPCSLFECFSFSGCSGWKVRDVRVKSTSLLLCVCVCVRVRVRAHAWASRAVKVRLIHWLELRGVERSAGFNSDQFGPLPLTNAVGLAKCLRQTARLESSARFLS